MAKVKERKKRTIVRRTPWLLEMLRILREEGPKTREELIARTVHLVPAEMAVRRLNHHRTSQAKQRGTHGAGTRPDPRETYETRAHKAAIAVVRDTIDNQVGRFRHGRETSISVNGDGLLRIRPPHFRKKNMRPWTKAIFEHLETHDTATRQELYELAIPLVTLKAAKKEARKIEAQRARAGRPTRCHTSTGAKELVRDSITSATRTGSLVQVEPGVYQLKKTRL